MVEFNGGIDLLVLGTIFIFGDRGEYRVVIPCSREKREEVVWLYGILLCFPDMLVLGFSRVSDETLRFVVERDCCGLLY